MSKYLVCFKAMYAYGESNFDRVVDWDGTDVSSLKSTLRDIIRDDYCSGKKIDVGITIISAFELKDSVQYVLIEEIIRPTRNPEMIIRHIGTEKDCRKTMCKIHSERPFKEIWYEVSGLHRWNYDDEDLEEDHTFMLLEYRGNANGY